MKTVYLAGPIAGLGYADAVDWRNAVIEDLDAVGIRGLSPMRAKEYLAGVTQKLEHPYPVGTPVRLCWVCADHETGRVVEHGPRGLSYMVDTGYRVVHANQSVTEAISTDIGFSATCEEYGHLSPLSGPRGIMTRDHFDATRCDVLLVNLLGAKKVSIGTVMEIAFGFQCRTPIVVAIEPSGNPHEHCMITEAIGFRCASLDEAVHVVKAILV